MRLHACPDAKSLEHLILGLLDERVADELERHISDCASCADTLRNLGTRDELIDALRGAAPVAVADAEISAVLLRMRKSLPPSREGQRWPVASAGDSAEALGTIREYRLLAKLGEGGMGTVYRAQHTKLKRQVAIKVLPPDRVQSPEAIARFEREMQAVGKLDHPHIVRAFDAGVHDGRHYLVMEFVKGRDVSQLVPSGKTLAMADACEIVRQAAIGLAHAHEAGLVHRDIKPSNLLVTDAGIVKILDLGLARMGQEDDGAGELTSTGAIMGTIDYMAPEQATSTHDVDIRADIYSLGATLYRLLTGRAPFFGECFDTPVKKLLALGTKSPTPIRAIRPEVTGALASLISDLLAKDPDDRPPTPADVAEALEPFCRGANLPRLMASLTPSGVDSAAPAKPQSQRKTEASYSNPDADTAPAIDRAASLFLRLGKEGDQSTAPFAPRGTGTGGEGAVAAKRQPHPLVAAWGGRNARRIVAIVAACGTALVLLLGVVFFLQTPEGTVRIEILDPNIRVTIEEGGKATFSGATKNHKIVLQPGSHGITITRGDLTFGTTSFELKKGDKPRLRIEYIAGKVHVTKDGAALPVIPKTRATNEQAKLPAAPPATLAESGRHGWPTDAPPPAIGSALEFNGRDSYVDLPTLKYDGSHPITIEAWATPWSSRDQGYSFIVSNVDDGFVDGKYWPSGIALQQRAPTSNAPNCWGAWVSTNIPPAGENQIVGPPTQWSIQGTFHLALQLNADRAQFYIDGKLIEDRRLNAAQRASEKHFTIGKRFGGRIRKVHLSKVARYVADFEPQRRVTPDEHTLALYHFDEGQGDVLTDSSGNNHHGKIIRAKWVPIQGASSEPNGSGN